MFFSFINKPNKRILFSLFAILLLIVLDQMTKIWAERALMGQEDRILIRGVLQLHYLENTGAAFSFLNGGTGLLIVLTLIIIIALFGLFVRIPNDRRYLPLSIDLIFLIAGALGNLIDRITNHYVVDFIYFSLIDFPVFNVADIYVTCSIAVLILLILFVYKEDDLAFLSLKTDAKKE